MNIDDLLGRKPKPPKDRRNKNLVVTARKVSWKNKDNQSFVRKVINENETMIGVAKDLGLSKHTVHYALGRYFKEESKKYRRKPLNSK
tara:strand:- start:50 stop:313 length:264 start_codon:yes stop_codon:yes gene_type:complete